MTLASDDDRALAGLLAATWLTCAEALAELCAHTADPSDALHALRLSARLVDPIEHVLELLGEAKDERMGTVRAATASLSEHTRPLTLAQAALKVHLLLGAACDLIEQTREAWPARARELLETAPAAADLDAPARVVLGRNLTAQGAEDESDARDRLSLYGRRFVGEATAQAQRVLAREPQIAAALVGAQEGSLDELSGTTQLLAQLVSGAADRMLALGLQP